METKPSAISWNQERIYRGRNPEWRWLWMTALGPGERAEVRRAAARGRAVREARLAPFVLGLAARRRRVTLWAFALSLLGSLLLRAILETTLSWLYVDTRISLLPYDLGLVVVWLVLVPVWLIRRNILLHRAEETNRQLLSQRSQPEAGKP